MTQLALERTGDLFAPPRVRRSTPLENPATPLELGKDTIRRIVQAMRKRGWRVGAIELRDLQHQPLEDEISEQLENLIRIAFADDNDSLLSSLSRSILISWVALTPPRTAPLKTSIRLFRTGVVVATTDSMTSEKYLLEELQSAIEQVWASGP